VILTYEGGLFLAQKQLAEIGLILGRGCRHRELMRDTTDRRALWR
jgi:hypothetical protein